MPAYSKTPLHIKLGIKGGDRVEVYGLDADYFKTLELDEGDFHLSKRPKKVQVDFMHLFVRDQEELNRCIKKYKPLLSKTGMMWVSWPKGASGIKTDLKRDYIREALIAMGLVDVKVVSFDDTWSGLKFVYRVKDR